MINMRASGDERPLMYVLGHVVDDEDEKENTVKVLGKLDKWTSRPEKEALNTSEPAARRNSKPPTKGRGAAARPQNESRTPPARTQQAKKPNASP